MIAAVKGRFTGVSGTLRTDEADQAGGAVEVAIDAASIDTREPQRDAHLRSPDFFDVERFPTITFRSTRLENVRGSGFRLVGDQTIRGVTREVVLGVTAEGRARDPWGGERAGFAATGRIRRADFGLTWNQVLESGGLMVADEVTITIDAELLRA